MKKFRLPALLLCLATLAGLLLSGCSKTKLDLVVGRVGNENVTYRDVAVFANYILMSNGYSRSDMTEEDVKALNENALGNAVTYKVTCQKAASLGLYPLSADSQKRVEDNTGQYIASIQASGMSLSSFGMTESDIRTLMTYTELNELLKAETTRDVTVTDDEIQTKYSELLANQQPSYSANPTAYDTALSGGAVTVVYRPAGYRYVKHILVAMPDEIASQISAAAGSGDTETVASLRKQGLAAIQEKADAALARVKNGEDFDALVAELGADPGMKAEPAKTEGYQVGAKSSFVPEFLEAAMALAKPGDTTGLVATDYGYHIIRYVAAVPEGPVPPGEVKDAIRASVLADKQTVAFTELAKQWESEAAIKKNPGKMPVG